MDSCLLPEQPRARSSRAMEACKILFLFFFSVELLECKFFLFSMFMDRDQYSTGPTC